MQDLCGQRQNISSIRGLKNYKSDLIVLYNFFKAVEIIRNCPETVVLVIDRNIEYQLSSASLLVEEREAVFEVEVEKENNGLGLVMTGGSDANIEYNGTEFFF